METDKEIVVENPYGFIYITTNMKNGMKYLGQRKLNQGWQSYLGSGMKLKKDIKTFGKLNFSRNIICFCDTPEELNQTEYDLSIFLNVVESPDWYNLVYGGGVSYGWHPSEETLKKKSLAFSGEKHPNYGKHHSEETKKKIGDAQRGEKAHWYGATGSKNPNYNNHKLAGKNNPMYGKTNENNPRARKVVQLTKDGVFIKEWPCIKVASIELKICSTNIVMCCRKTYKSAGGFVWIYADEYYINNTK
jgi:group I intron endonuclease